MSMLNRRQALATFSAAAAGAALTPRALARPRRPMLNFDPPAYLAADPGPLKLPPLPYAENALEPFIDAETMQIHHGKHHQAYVDNANKALAGTPWEGKPADQILRALGAIPEDKRTAIRNNVGGHVNHSLFWTIMRPPGGDAGPAGPLADALNSAFGSFDQPGGFKEKFAAAASARFGSGWAWLVVNDGSLGIVSTANQDNPMMGANLAGCAGTPILGLDVWEHAYYLKYRNKRADYIAGWWNVVNWSKVAELYAAAR